MDTDKDIIRLTRAIHNFVRGKLSWEESLQLFDKISDSDEWMDFLWMRPFITFIKHYKNSSEFAI